MKVINLDRQFPRLSEEKAWGWMYVCLFLHS